MRIATLTSFLALSLSTSAFTPSSTVYDKASNEINQADVYFPKKYLSNPAVKLQRDSTAVDCYKACDSDTKCGAFYVANVGGPGPEDCYNIPFTVLGNGDYNDIYHDRLTLFYKPTSAGKMRKFNGPLNFAATCTGTSCVCKDSTYVIDDNGECKVTCPAPSQIDYRTSTGCSCPAPNYINSSGKCTACTAPATLNSSGNSCECKAPNFTDSNGICQTFCTGGFVLNQGGDRCICRAPFYLDPASSQCLGQCGTGFTYNARTLGCDCLSPSSIKNGICSTSSTGSPTTFDIDRTTRPPVSSTISRSSTGSPTTFDGDYPSSRPPISSTRSSTDATTFDGDRISSRPTARTSTVSPTTFDGDHPSSRPPISSAVARSSSSTTSVRPARERALSERKFRH